MKIFGRDTRVLTSIALAGLLAACGGSGDDNNAGGGGGAPGGYVLFATDEGTGSIAAFTTLEPVAGQALTAHVVKTDEGGTAIAYDAVHDDLYAIRVGTITQAVTIDVFAHASTMTSGAAPARTILVPGFSPATVQAIRLDTTRDELWVGGLDAVDSNSEGRLSVFAHASTLDGSATPSRDIGALPPFLTFALDKVRSVLYLAGAGGTEHGVYVFANASTLVSGTAPTRTIDAVDGTSTYLLAVDEQRDILYVPDVFTGLGIVKNASTASPTLAATVAFPSATPCLTAAVDSSHDRLYVGAYTNAYILDGASTLTSASTLPAVTVQAPTGSSIFSFAFP